MSQSFPKPNEPFCGDINVKVETHVIKKKTVYDN